MSQKFNKKQKNRFRKRFFVVLKRKYLQNRRKIVG